MFAKIVIEQIASWCVIAGAIGAGIGVIRLLMSGINRKKVDYWIEWSMRAAALPLGVYFIIPKVVEIIFSFMNDGIFLAVIISVIGVLLVLIALMQFISPRSIKTAFPL